MDPNLRRLIDVGYAELVLSVALAPPDYWDLTPAGRAWLAAHDSETA